MKIGVISDTHGGLWGWERSWEVLKNSDYIIHCGDLFNHGPGNPIPEKYSPKELLNIFNNINLPLFIAKGNCDSEVDQTFLNLPISYPFLFLNINEIRILVSHGNLYKKEEWINLGMKWKIKFLILGHTHIPLIEKIDNLILLNPGSPSLPKENIPTCAEINLKSNLIKIYNLTNFSILKEETI